MRQSAGFYLVKYIGISMILNRKRVRIRGRNAEKGAEEPGNWFKLSGIVLNRRTISTE